MKVGSLLLAAAARVAKGVGAVRLTLSTEITNQAAQALYEAEGYRSGKQELLRLTVWLHRSSELTSSVSVNN